MQAAFEAQPPTAEDATTECISSAEDVFVRIDDGDDMSKHSRWMASGSNRLRDLILVLAAFALAGCATTHPMMPTPALYTGPQAKPLFTERARRRPDAPARSAVHHRPRSGDRAADEPEPYTADRSRSMAFGSTTILFGEGVTWDALVKQSLLTERTTSLDLKLGPTKELGRFPRIPYEVTESRGRLTRTPAVVDAHEAATRALQAEVARRLAPSPRKEVVLYVHGYHNTFQDAALTMGELCHFLGREFVCGDLHLARGRKARHPVRLRTSTTNRAYSRSSTCGRRSARSPGHAGPREDPPARPQPRDRRARHRAVRVCLRGVHAADARSPGATRSATSC